MERNWTKDVTHYCSNCGLRLGTWCRGDKQAQVEEYQGCPNSPVHQHEGTRLSVLSTATTVAKETDQIPQEKHRDSATTEKSLDGSSVHNAVRSPLGTPRVKPTAYSKPPQQSPHQVLYIRPLKDHKAQWIVSLAKDPSSTSPIYEITAHLPSFAGYGAPEPATSLTCPPQLHVHRCVPDHPGLDPIGSARFFTAKWDIVVTIASQPPMTLTHPLGKPGWSRSLKWTSPTHGLLSWNEAIRYGMLLKGYRLVDHYGRLCAEFKYISWKGRSKTKSHRLELYGEFEQAFVDEVVVTLLAVLEQAERKGKWLLEVMTAD